MVEGVPLPDDLEERFEELTPEQVDNVERAAGRLAEEKRRQQRIERNETDDVTEASRAEKAVPLKANVVVKTINGNDYEYWQWRNEEGKVTSQYKGPVDDSE